MTAAHAPVETPAGAQAKRRGWRLVPVVALPGWYTQNSVQRPEVLVSNCRNPSFMVGSKFGTAFSPAMRKRIARFPFVRMLESFDCSAQRSLDPKQAGSRPVRLQAA